MIWWTDSGRSVRIFFPQLNVVGLFNSAHECVRPSLLDFLFSDPPIAGGHCCYCRIPPTNNFKIMYFLNSVFHYTTYFEPISPSLTFFPRLNVVGFLNSAHECARSSSSEICVYKAARLQARRLCAQADHCGCSPEDGYCDLSNTYLQ